MNFFARKNKRSRLTVTLVLLTVMALDLVLPITTAKSQSGPQGPILIPGQTATRLPDGRWLLAGGESTGSSLATAAIWNPLTGNTTQLAADLQQARAWHSATMLPEGQVLILGGVGPNGRALQSAELFNLETQSFSTLVIDGLNARSRHTTTLLTDGHVLIAGGTGADGQTLATADLWNSDNGTLTPVSPFATARRGHTATLLADGRVLLWGGVDSAGQAQNTGEVFDLFTSQFTHLASFPISLFPSSTDTPVLAASIPPDQMTDVPSDALIAIRFSKPLRPETINSGTITLGGPRGIESIRVVTAENGRLAYITPEVLLLPDATYTVTINGAADQDGLPLPASGFSFSTPRASSVAAAPAAQSSSSSLQAVPPPATSERSPSADSDDDWVWTGAKKDGKPHSPWQDLGPLKAEHGETALAGQVLDLKGEPLVNVNLKTAGEYGDESASAQTDDTGRFLLTEIKSGEGKLLIDGRSANKPGKKYGIFEVYVKIKEGETNVLSYTIWMPKIDTAHALQIASPTTSEVILTTPKIPNLEVRIPAGAVIRDHEYNIVTEIGITPLPLDRPPFALPPRDVNPPAFFTVQPGVSKIYSTQGGARLIYPNYTENPKPPRSRFDAWHYDADRRGWYIYGQSSVTEDGTQIVPDPGVAVYKFTGAMHGNQPAPPQIEPTGTEGADPVDLGSGLFVLRKTDLMLPDVIPVTLTRTYRQNDNVSRPFGIGATHPYEIYLYSINTYQDVDLILPDGRRIHYIRISPGTGFENAVYEHTATPTRFYKSQIAWNGQGWTLTLKDGTLYKFPESCPGCPSGALNEIHDRNGNKLLISRTGTNQFNDPFGNITQITSPNGRWIKFTSDASNRITQAKDNAGRTVTYEYDTSGRLFKVTDPNGGTTEYTYDTSNRMLTIKDARSILYITNEYDTAGRVKKQTMIDGGIYNIVYTTDANGKITQTDLTDPRGNIRRVVFNSAGYPTSDTLALSKPEEQVTTYQRDAISNLPTSVTDALNRVTTYVYDSMGNVTSVTRLSGTPDAVTTTYTYEPTFNKLATITDPLNHTTSFSYDSTGNLTTITDALNNPTTMTYNAQGQLASSTNALSHTTQFTNDLGDLVTITDPLGNVTERFIDGIGRQSAMTNPLGNATRYEYDPLSRLTKVTDSLSGLTQFSYDPNGNLLSLTDAKSGSTGYTYDNMDRLATRTDPLLRGESYVYDNNGNLSQFTDRKSQATTYTYDALNRRTGTTYGDLSTTTYTYDKGNRLLQINDSISGIITRTYDGLDRLTSETTPQGSVSYTYDAAGRRSTMTVQGQPTVTYTYDNANRLTQITQGSSIVSLAYDVAGRRTSLTLPNGILVEYVYDNASRITSIAYKQNGTTVLGDLTYEYDKIGSRTKIGGSFARTGIPQGIASTAYNAGNQQTTFGDKTLTYDNNGNLTSIVDGSGTTLYTWNPRNQLVGISGPNVNATFVYDGLGRREKKTINSNLTEFLYDGVNPVQETSGAAVLANILTGLGIDEFFTRTDVPAATTSHFLADALGSALALADSAGIVQTEYTYQPFGSTTATGASSTNPFQYTGRENDGTGLYYYRARYYAPGSQRFISEDPYLHPLYAKCALNPGLPINNLAVFAATGSLDLNMYSYVSNNPLAYIDSFGLDKEPPCKSPFYCDLNSVLDVFNCSLSCPARSDTCRKECREKGHKNRKICCETGTYPT